MASTLSLRARNRATLARQHLLSRAALTVDAMLGEVLCIQAQWPRPPFLALWSRLADFTPDLLTRALVERTVVRGTFLRGTLHLARATDFTAHRLDLQAMLTTAATRTLKDRAAGLDVGALAEVARGVLAEGPRTFSEIRDALAAAFPAADVRAMGHLVRTSLPLVQVPATGTPAPRWAFPADADFGLAEAWVGGPLSPPAGPDTLILRALSAIGPATVAELQAFTGLSGLAPVVKRLRDRLVVFTDERGKETFDLPDAPRPDPETPAPPRLLPEFDNCIVTRAEPRFVPEAHRGRVFLPGLRVLPVYLIDGVAAGTWSIDERAKGASSASVGREPGGVLTKVKRKLATLRLSPFEGDTITAGAREALVVEAEAMLKLAEPEAGERRVVFEAARQIGSAPRTKGC